MEENFNPVARTRANYYTPGSPVQFVCVELLKGEVSGEQAVCLTFKNISRVTLTALEIHFKCKGVDGVILCEDKFEYRDLQVKPGELFGQDDAVFITAKAITSVDVTLCNVYNGKRVVHLDGIKRVRLPAPRRLAPELQKALEAVETHFGAYLDRIKWLNMGGGHLMTHKDYDCDELIRILQEFKAKYPNLRLILEPGSAFTWRTGYLVSTVEDIVENGGVRTAMLDVSFACHMPDCLEMPYKPAILGARDPEPGEKGWRMGGNSCLAGDYYGDWIFDRDLRVGDRIVFEDMIHYTMVKTTMFNGVAHPAIAVADADGAVRIVREFGYADFKGRMS